MTQNERLERLEAESAIRALKARYLNACDEKDAQAMRACFSEDALIDFPPLGEFDLDGLVEIFTTLAVNTKITDVHQAHNAEITITGNNAQALWNFSYATYNPEDRRFRLLSAFYHDRYKKTDKGWLISYSRSEPRAFVDGTLDETGLTAEFTAN